MTEFARSFCYRCHKPALTCICARIARVDNRTHIRVIQHPRERFHPIGTARIARLGLANVAIEVAYERPTARPPTLAGHAGLLYPGPGARDLGSLRPGERPSTLVVVDGTWSHARTMFRDHRWLRELPRYGLKPPASRYRLRQEPALDCVSTIEAIVEALRILEPDTAGIERLLTSFEAMIDDQLAIIAARRTGPRQPAVGAWRRGGARIVAHEPERLVAVAAEGAPRDADDPHTDRLVLQWAALRIATGECFEQFVRPPSGRFPSACHLVHMGLDAADVEAGVTPARLREVWSGFLRPSDVLVSWTPTPLSLMTEPGITLKSLYCSRHRGRLGPLAELTARLGLAVTIPPVRGRAASTLGRLAALLAHLQATAHPKSLRGEPA